MDSRFDRLQCMRLHLQAMTAHRQIADRPKRLRSLKRVDVIHFLTGQLGVPMGPP